MKLLRLRFILPVIYILIMILWYFLGNGISSSCSGRSWCSTEWPTMGWLVSAIFISAPGVFIVGLLGLLFIPIQKLFTSGWSGMLLIFLIAVFAYFLIGWLLEWVIHLIRKNPDIPLDSV